MFTGTRTAKEAASAWWQLVRKRYTLAPQITETVEAAIRDRDQELSEAAGKEFAALHQTIRILQEMIRSLEGSHGEPEPRANIAAAAAGSADTGSGNTDTSAPK